MKMNLIASMKNNDLVSKTYFHMKGFAPGLVLNKGKRQLGNALWSIIINNLIVFAS